MSQIEVKGISKSFGDTRALDNVSLTFGDNKLYGLLGRNGAGKSTLLNIITNRLFADSGQVLVDGEPAAENDRALSRIYLMSEQTLYPESMKIKDALRWTKNFYCTFDLDYAKKLAENFQLNLNSRVKSLSTGYSSIFKLVLALSTNAPYVFLDEPVLGLDANHRDLFYRILLAKYTENPFTAVISTHLIEEVSNVIEDVVILKDGRVIRNESRESLLADGYTVSGPAQEVESYIRDKDVLAVDRIGGLRTAYVKGTPSRENLPAGVELSGMDLQKLFIELTNS